MQEVDRSAVCLCSVLESSCTTCLRCQMQLRKQTHKCKAANNNTKCSSKATNSQPHLYLVALVRFAGHCGGRHTRSCIDPVGKECVGCVGAVHARARVRQCNHGCPVRCRQPKVGPTVWRRFCMFVLSVLGCATRTQHD